ncbi:hypothetical protein O0I63_10895, partial [Stenotrophomonas sp. Sm8]
MLVDLDIAVQQTIRRTARIVLLVTRHEDRPARRSRRQAERSRYRRPAVTDYDFFAAMAGGTPPIT